MRREKVQQYSWLAFFLIRGKIEFCGSLQLKKFLYSPLEKKCIIRILQRFIVILKYFFPFTLSFRTRVAKIHLYMCISITAVRCFLHVLCYVNNGIFHNLPRADMSPNLVKDWTCLRYTITLIVFLITIYLFM